MLRRLFTLLSAVLPVLCVTTAKAAAEWVEVAGIEAGPNATFAFSADGGRMVLTYDGSAQVWDATAGKPLTDPLTHGAAPQVVTATLSPDGELVATGDNHGSVWVREMTGKQVVRRYPAERRAEVTWLAFTAEGTKLAAVGGGEATVWDLSTGRALHRVRPPGGLATGAFAADGHRLLGRDRRGAAFLWDAATGRPLVGPLDPDELPHPLALALSRDGKRLVTSGPQGRVRVWDAESGGVLATIQADPNTLVAVPSPDGLRVCTAGGRATQVWDVGTGRPVGAQMPKNGHFVGAVRFTADGSRVLVSGQVDHTGVWEWATGRQEVRVEPKQWDFMPPVAMSPDGGTVAVHEAETIRVWKRTARERDVHRPTSK